MDYENLLIVFAFLIIPPLLVWAGYFFVNKYFPKIIFAFNRFLYKINNPYFLFTILIILTVAGFYFHIGYRVTFSCCNTSEDININPYKNIELAIISIGLIFLGFIKRNISLGRALLCAELLLWLFFLFFIRGTFNLIYDSLAIILRFLLLRNLFNSSLKFRFIALVIYLIFLTKLMVFDEPLFSLHDKYFSVEAIDKSKSLIQGIWIGAYEFNMEKMDTIKKEHSIKPKNKKTLIDLINEADTNEFEYRDTFLRIKEPISIKISNEALSVFLPDGKSIKYYFEFYYEKTFGENPKIKLFPESLPTLEKDSYLFSNGNFRINYDRSYKIFGREIFDYFKFERKSYDLQIIRLNTDSLIMELNYEGVEMKLKRKQQ